MPQPGGIRVSYALSRADPGNIHDAVVEWLEEGLAGPYVYRCGPKNWYDLFLYHEHDIIRFEMMFSEMVEYLRKRQCITRRLLTEYMIDTQLPRMHFPT